MPIHPEPKQTTMNENQTTPKESIREQPADKGLDAVPCSVIFLDFDGVIRITMDGGWLGPDRSEFCQLRMKVLREVCQKTRAKIVVSSDWRNIGNRSEIEGHLSPYLADQLHDDWATPITGHRWNEVATWLRKHPEVTSYAILEDFAPHFEGCPPEMEKRLMLCTNRHGLVPASTERLLCILPQNS